jgi:hypothetical protein
VTKSREPSVHQSWAHLRFSVVGHLLAAPPGKGELRAALEKLAAREWRHPATGEPTRFGVSTIERWYYQAIKERCDPVGVLRRKVRKDAGQQVAMAAPVRQALLAQYAAHKGWTVQLHFDNLVALRATSSEPVATSVDERITCALAAAGRPVPLAELRAACRVRTATLCDRLAALTAQGRLTKVNAGYCFASG